MLCQMLKTKVLTHEEHIQTQRAWLAVPDTNSHMTCSTDTYSRVTCSKKIQLFINWMQLQGFPIDSHTFAWVSILVLMFVSKWSGQSWIHKTSPHFCDKVLCNCPNRFLPPPPELAHLVSPRSHSLQTAPCPASGAPPDHSPPQTDSDGSRSQMSRYCFLCPWWRTVGREEEDTHWTLYTCVPDLVWSTLSVH